jgi:crossover junction endodeoxyribonuclease RusA
MNNGRQFFLELPYPPSVNTYWRKFRNTMVISEKGREFTENVRKIVAPIITEPITCRIKIEMRLHREDKRQFDLDNTLKAVQDALTKCGLWIDDKQIDVIVLRRGEISPRDGFCRILVEEIDQMDGIDYRASRAKLNMSLPKKKK